MTFYGPTWKGVVRSVSEDTGWNPKIDVELIAWRSDLDDPPSEQRLPRAGELYWLVSHDIFMRLTGDDA